MTSPLTADLGARVRLALRPLAGPLVHRSVTTVNAKAAALAAAGSTALSITGMPVGFAGIEAGDVLLTGGRRTFTAAVPAVGGTVTAAPLSAALVAPIAAGAVVTVQRNADRAVFGWMEDAGEEIAVGIAVVTAEAVVNIMTDSMAEAPPTDSFLVVGGTAWQVKAAASDAMGAVWRCRVVR